MNSSTISILISVVALCLAGCAPAQIDEDQFPDPADSCYSFSETAESVHIIQTRDDSVVQPAGCTSPNGEKTQGTNSRETVSSSEGTLPGGVDQPDGGVAGVGVAGTVSDAFPATGTMLDGQVTASCDVEALFRKPVTLGGCVDNEVGGCHETGATGEFPDLQSPQLLSRLLSAPSRCEDVPGLLLIEPGAGATGSFLYNKLTRDFVCGDAQMPAEPASPLSAQQLRCVRQWVEQVANGVL